MRDSGLAGCLVAIFMIFGVFAFCFCINLLITKAIIWVAAGLFNYDLSDKFWYVFVGLMLFSMLLKPRITISKN